MEDLTLIHDIFFDLLCGGVITLDLVAALYVLLRRGNAFVSGIEPPIRLRRWAAAFFISVALGHVYWLYVAFHYSQTTYVIGVLLDVLYLIITFSGIMLSMLQDRKRHIWPVLLSLVPFSVLVVLSLILEDTQLLMSAYMYGLCLLVLFSAYMVFAIRSYGRWLRDNFADLEHKEFWRSMLVLAVLLLAMLLYTKSDEDGIFYIYALQVVNLLVVGLLLWRVETLQQLDNSNTVKEKPTQDAEESLPSQEVPDVIGLQLKKYCEDTLLFLQYDLTLAQLAQVIGTNRSYLSQYFSRQGLTYNAYINGLRVEHFIRLYQEAVSSHRTFTANQLSSESGFSSYSTFSAAFKQKMGKTFTAWMSSASK